MTGFFDKLPFDLATRMAQFGRLMYELREDRLQLLAPYAAADEAALLQQIRTGQIDEHPAYEHYLGARALQESYAAVRADLRALLHHAGNR